MATLPYVRPDSSYYRGLYLDTLTIATADTRYVRIGSTAALASLTTSNIICNDINVSNRVSSQHLECESTDNTTITSSSSCDNYGLHLHAILNSSTGFKPSTSIAFNNSLTDNVPLANILLDKIGTNQGELSFGTRNGSTCDERLRITSSGINITGNLNITGNFNISNVDFSTSLIYKTIIRKDTSSGNGIEFYDTQFSTPTNNPLINFKTENNSDPIFFRLCGYLNDNSTMVANGQPHIIKYTSGVGFTSGLNITCSNTTQASNSNYNVVLSARNGTIPHVVVNDSKNQLHLFPQNAAEINTSYAQNVIIGEELLVRKCLCVGTSQDTSRLISALDSTQGTATSRYITLGKDATSKNQAEISFYYDSGGSSSNRLDFGFFGGALLYLTAGGRLGLGTSAPKAPLEIASTNNTSYTVVSISTNSYSYDVSTNSWLNRGGGPFTLTNINAWFNGNIYVANGLWATSDRRLKSNIKSIDMDIERYKLLNPVSYTYKNDPKTKLGLIAQEVMKVCSEAIGMVPNENLKEENDDDIDQVQMSLDYNAITILNVDIIKKLINRVEQLETLVNQLIDLLPKTKKASFNIS